MPRCHKVATVTLVLVPVMAPEVRAQVLLAVDGVELHGTAQLVMSDAATCNVLESDTAYERKRANHGTPLDVWRLDFSVRNGSGQWIDRLVARYGIESAWPECTNWRGPDPAEFQQQFSSATIEWADTIGLIQETGRNVVAPDETLTDTKFIIALRSDPQPRFTNWSTDFDFAEPVAPATPAAETAGAPSASPPSDAALEALFWESIRDSTTPAEFEAYLAQFPNGVFRALAAARLAALRAPGGDPPTPAGGQAQSRAVPDNPPAVPSPRRADTAPAGGQPELRAVPDNPPAVPSPRRADAAPAGGQPESPAAPDNPAAVPSPRPAGGADVARRRGEVFRDCDACPEMVVMPSGRLALGRYEVTVGEYRAFASATGAAAGDCFGRTWRNPGFPQTDRHPVACVNWDDAQAYVSWLSQTTGAAYRLPTEAEWALAAVGSQRGCDDGRTGQRGTCPVGSYGANRGGLSDMVGSVWEWTQACWEGGCGRRVVRGGSWSSDVADQRGGARGGFIVTDRDSFVGFRVARTLD